MRNRWCERKPVEPEMMEPKMLGPKLSQGKNRQWVKCKECGNVAYYDYVPYSLSNPIMIPPCGHGITQPFYNTQIAINENEARQYIYKNSKEMG